MNYIDLMKKFERFIIIILVILMGLVLLVTTFELIYFIVKEVIKSLTEGKLLLEKKEMLKIFELFFHILIGLELYETVKLYLEEDVFHAEFVLLVGLIAVARKVIIMDYADITFQKIISIAILISVLAGGYYLLKLAQKRNKNFPGKK